MLQVTYHTIFQHRFLRAWHLMVVGIAFVLLLITRQPVDQGTVLRDTISKGNRIIRTVP